MSGAGWRGGARAAPAVRAGLSLPGPSTFRRARTSWTVLRQSAILYARRARGVEGKITVTFTVLMPYLGVILSGFVAVATSPRAPASVGSEVPFLTSIL